MVRDMVRDRVRDRVRAGLGLGVGVLDTDVSFRVRIRYGFLVTKVSVPRDQLVTVRVRVA